MNHQLNNHSIENRHKKILRTIKARSDAKRTPSEKLADWMTSTFGSMTFLIFNGLLFLFWILINSDVLSFIAPFDPFPFNLLTTFVSLEAIFLAVFVLISQNRNLKVDDLREELHLQVDLIAEREVTKVIKMISILLEKNGVDVSNDPELRKFVKPISESDIEKKLEREIL